MSMVTSSPGSTRSLMTIQVLDFGLVLLTSVVFDHCFQQLMGHSSEA